ncbi:hypothetical protein J2B92_17340 [Lysinibacillus sphaericus]|uniref:hypothetical protein n=1 Tax=Lysinibacillus sphaericus TaxID=1421 RepID=UPI0018CEB42E|nr:hypothetical protein [Lysinibacillus sphaericus]MBG9756374.1 hypothetical protein [Lysinibacillus sphaericus]QTB12606.1 hypothetical protein J2B92_17340 [Lysinibacillus sphaericus]
MNKYTGEFYVQSAGNDKIFVGDQVRCSWNSKGVCGGCWHGEITRITSRGIYIDVGNKRDKYVCFADIQELTLKYGG